ncbi:MAG: hypothetical protein IJC73_04845, partial [Lentisphaeria bacterium]|nr:hypothetical protein [Lentisphaeria bacterium]
TSNLGSDRILEGITPEGDLSPQARQEVEMLLRRHFRPEFLNRIDETLIFHKLGLEHMVAILDIQLRRFAGRLKNQNIGFVISDSAKRFIAANGTDEAFGARPLKRAVIRLLENPVSRLIIGGGLESGMTLQVDLEQDKLTFHSTADPV